MKKKEKDIKSSEKKFINQNDYKPKTFLKNIYNLKF